jgi:hypothetical protein
MLCFEDRVCTEALGELTCYWLPIGLFPVCSWLVRAPLVVHLLAVGLRLNCRWLVLGAFLGKLGAGCPTGFLFF